jgi:hypothetical protein
MSMGRLSSSALAACRAALHRGFAVACPDVALDGNGYVSDAGLNLLEGVERADFEDDLRQGDGNELEGKFRAAHSSSALAVNTFAPFRRRLGDLTLPGGRAFTSLCFERKCPHGLLGRKPPNLDAVVECRDGIVAIESKCLEPLSPHVAKFAPAYKAEITDARSRTAWFAEMLRLMDEPGAYRWLDAAQLIKHALGLAHTFPGRPITLLYLFWEPSNPDAHAIFAAHREEASRFGARVRDGGVQFLAMSYPELWQSWRSGTPPQWLSVHLDRLAARYSVAA